MKKMIIITLVLALGMQVQSYAQSIYEAYLSGSLTLWEKAIVSTHGHLNKEEVSTGHLAYAIDLYGLLSATMATKDERMFDKYVDKTIEILQSLISKNRHVSESKALLSAVYGLKIAYSPMTGMYYGAKSAKLIDEAMELSPTNALVRKLHGNYLYFTPEMWGGDIGSAINEYKEAIRLYKSKAEETNWHQVDTYAWLGMAQVKNGQKPEALKTYEEVLSLAPDFYWVKNNLINSAR